MNKRRKLIVALGASALVSPLSSFAQPAKKVWRIGFLGSEFAAGYGSNLEALRAGLRDLGYAEGKNIAIESRWAEGKYERLPDLAAELVRLKVDVIVTHGTPGTRAAKLATTTIPIVIATSGDPVAMGLVASLARPGGNVTGSATFTTELMAKRLELLKEAVPRIKLVAVLANALNPSRVVDSQEMETAAKALKMGLHRFEVRGPDDFERAFSALAKTRVDAIVVHQDGMLNANSAAIAALAASQRLPSAGFKEFGESGGLIGYGANFLELYRHAAVFIDKILKGAKPLDIPVERATKFELVVNMKTAKALGITIPNSILLRADKVIE